MVYLNLSKLKVHLILIIHIADLTLSFHSKWQFDIIIYIGYACLKNRTLFWPEKSVIRIWQPYIQQQVILYPSRIKH